MTTFFLRNIAVQQSPELSLEERLKGAVKNSGNMLFEAALAYQLRSDVKHIRSINDIPQDAERVILSMSNIINQFSNMEHLANSLEKKNVQNVVMIGVGAQAAGFDAEVTLQEGTKRLIDIIHERSASIGVRGEYTANILRKLGYSKIDIIGCPSVYWPMDAGWGDFRRPNYGMPIKAAVHSTPTGKYRDKVGEILNYAFKNDYYYICQNELNFFDPWQVDERGKKKLKYEFLYYLKGNSQVEEVVEHLQDKSRIFFSLEEWISFIGSLDLVIGSRFHGNVVAMLAGRPNLHMVFDSRTRELVEFLNLPYIHLDDFSSDLPIEHYMEMADFSFFRSTYRINLAKYMSFLDDNGVPHRVGEKYLSKLPSALERDSVQYNSAMNLVSKAVGTGMPENQFSVELERRISLGRSELDRDKIEVA